MTKVAPPNNSKAMYTSKIMLEYKSIHKDDKNSGSSNIGIGSVCSGGSYATTAAAQTHGIVSLYAVAAAHTQQ